MNMVLIDIQAAGPAISLQKCLAPNCPQASSLPGVPGSYNSSRVVLSVTAKAHASEVISRGRAWAGLILVGGDEPDPETRHTVLSGQRITMCRQWRKCVGSDVQVVDRFAFF